MTVEVAHLFFFFKFTDSDGSNRQLFLTAWFIAVFLSILRQGLTELVFALNNQVCQRDLFNKIPIIL